MGSQLARSLLILSGGVAIDADMCIYYYNLKAFPNCLEAFCCFERLNLKLAAAVCKHQKAGRAFIGF